MKETIIKRIQEVTQEINDLLEEKEFLLNNLQTVDNKITHKTGAILELKLLVDTDNDAI